MNALESHATTPLIPLLLTLCTLLACFSERGSSGSGGSVQDSPSGTLTWEEVTYPVEVSAEWEVHDDPACGTAQIGLLRIVLAGETEDVKFSVNQTINFDGLKLPPMPMEPHNNVFDCPYLASGDPRGGLAFIRGTGPSAERFLSKEGTATLEASRQGEQVHLVGALDGIEVLNEDSGETIRFNASFEELGAFVDYTQDRRFTEPRP